MPTDHDTALLAAKSHLAGLHVIRALQILIDLTSHKDFNPDQPRVPEGEPGAGQWTSSDGTNDGSPDEDPLQTPSIGDDSEQPQDASRRRAGPTGTPAQEARLAIATGQAQQAVSRVMESDLTWRGPTSVTNNIEGQIAHQEAMAEAANVRLAEIARSSIGSNGGPPLGRDPPPRFSMPQAPYAVDAYRNNFDVPAGNDTIAVGTIDNDARTIVGVNSRAPGYTAEDRAAANAMRDTLVISDPDVMRSDNMGYKPNDAVYHAEATALLRAAKVNDGSLDGRVIDIYVDREMCRSCDKVLPLISREFGYPTVRFTDFYGKRVTLRNGRWE